MKSWTHLTQSARDASPPADIDLRAAIRAEITSEPAIMSQPSLVDDLAGLIRLPWLQAGLAAFVVIAYLSCRDGLDVVNELAFIWQLQGPVLSGI
ncbi:MAG TPA: hypothetical protein DDZ88_01250 [Verrucomicrobiales bacterium]|nr:hypothetical protein [Verrucomicrobiales bacterium]